MSDVKVDGISDAEIERFERFMGTLSQFKLFSRDPNAISEHKWLCHLENFTAAVRDAVQISTKAALDLLSAQSCAKHAKVSFPEFYQAETAAGCAQCANERAERLSAALSFYAGDGPRRVVTVDIPDPAYPMPGSRLIIDRGQRAQAALRAAPAPVPDTSVELERIRRDKLAYEQKAKDEKAK